MDFSCEFGKTTNLCRFLFLIHRTRPEVNLMCTPHFLFHFRPYFFHRKNEKNCPSNASTRWKKSSFCSAIHFNINHMRIFSLFETSKQIHENGLWNCTNIAAEATRKKEMKMKRKKEFCSAKIYTHTFVVVRDALIHDSVIFFCFLWSKFMCLYTRGTQYTLKWTKTTPKNENKEKRKKGEETNRD